MPAAIIYLNRYKNISYLVHQEMYKAKITLRIEIRAVKMTEDFELKIAIPLYDNLFNLIEIWSLFSALFLTSGFDLKNTFNQRL